MPKLTILETLPYLKEKELDMEQQKSSTTSRKGKHLTRKERIQMEVLLRKGYSKTEIANTLERDRSTISREYQRGKVEHLNSDLTEVMVYSSDRGQDVHDMNGTAKGPQLKLGTNHELVEYVSVHILEGKDSPAVVAERMRENDIQGRVCAKTLYSYIDQGLIRGVTNETLLEKRKRRKRKNKHIVRSKKKHHARRTSIDKRPEHVQNREEFGHWEIDLVVGPVGSSGAVLLTLTERKTRMEIIRKLPDKTQESVLKAINCIERSMGPKAFRNQFKSITADNGSEFLDVEKMQRSVFSKKRRVKLYYAHPYSSWERGSNENANRIIRRFIAKGKDIGKFTKHFIQDVENWINNYPRKILNYRTAKDCFNSEVSS